MAPETDPRPARPRRRRVVRVLLLVTAGVAALGAGAFAWAYAAARVDTVGDVAFERPVRVPELDRGTVGDDGVRRFSLEARAGEADLGDGDVVETMGYDGPHLGPVLRAERGERVAVEVTNALDELTTVHWHGMLLPAAADGGPHQPIGPGEVWRPSWTIDQPAATTWFHPHPHGDTERQVAAGLVGMFLVDDGPVPAGLPDEYGVDDVPLLLQTGQRGDGLLDGVELGGIGAVGDEVLVNGTRGPYLDVTTEAVRLRLLNASPARTLHLALSDDRPMALVAGDLGLLPAPVDVTRLPLSPGERAEVVVRVAPGERVVLRSEPIDLGGRIANRFSGADDRLDVLELRAADDLAPSPSLPDRLAVVEALEPGEQLRTFDLSGSSVNGRAMDMDRVDLVARPGAVETWVVTASGGHHNFHAHGVRFQVLDVDGVPPLPEMQGWQDTVLVRGGERVRLAVLVDDHTDPSSPYMFHCHLLRHEDAGMMGQFVVHDEGDAPALAHDHGG